MANLIPIESNCISIHKVYIFSPFFFCRCHHQCESQKISDVQVDASTILRLLPSERKRNEYFNEHGERLSKSRRGAGKNLVIRIRTIFPYFCQKKNSK